MTTQRLVVLLDDVEIGLIHRDRHGKLVFTYDEAWRTAPQSYPISLSMPLTAASHPHDAIEPFLWGLLPENDMVLQRWARNFHVARSAFSLLSHVGEDCPGALQLVPPSTLDDLRRSSTGHVQWLSESDVAERLRVLRGDTSAWRLIGDTGQFSLAGAQSKTALLRQGKRWGIPSGRTPTTHILKPPLPDLAGHVENEHFCLALAREVGLPTASSELLRFDEEIAIVVTRYDRARVGGRYYRVHQEDLCQASGISPQRKYESEGGPSATDVVNLLRNVSSEPFEDVTTFVRALAFAWLIGGTDAHAKNYSLLLTPGPRVRLAPLYDLASILPYPTFDSRRAKLAMKIGGKYRLREIGVRQWLEFARQTRLDGEELRERLRALADELPDRAATVKARLARSGLKSVMIDALVAQLTTRSRECFADLEA
jgi:serine/threonine-protein kinase HipA